MTLPDEEQNCVLAPLIIRPFGSPRKAACAPDLLIAPVTPAQSEDGDDDTCSPGLMLRSDDDPSTQMLQGFLPARYNAHGRLLHRWRSCPVDSHKQHNVQEKVMIRTRFS